MLQPPKLVEIKEPWCFAASCAGRIGVVEGPSLPEGATVELDVKSVRSPDQDPAAAFCGMWADRADLGDARDFVSRLRDEEWRR